MNKPNCYIVDIDGTIALKGDRAPYGFDKVEEDKPNEAIIDIICSLTSGFANMTGLIFVTGRPEACKESTTRWLSLHVDYSPILFMRPDGDNTPDDELKKRIYQEEIEPHYNVLAVFDDRDKVVKMWRSLGLTCLQVAGRKNILLEI